MGHSTREKGDLFEDRVYRRLKEAFRERRFGLDPSQAIFRRKPSYYSRDRDANIQFDLSVEFRAAQAPAPFFTIVIECKDYTKPVPVDDIEEFTAKLDQCFGKNVKGRLISSNVLQKSALKVATARGIGVGRIIEDRLDMIAYHIGDASVADMVEYERETYDAQAEDALLNEHHAGTRTSFGTYDSFFIVDGEPIASFGRALATLRGRSLPG